MNSNMYLLKGGSGSALEGETSKGLTRIAPITFKVHFWVTLKKQQVVARLVDCVTLKNKNFRCNLELHLLWTEMILEYFSVLSIR